MRAGADDEEGRATDRAAVSVSGAARFKSEIGRGRTRRGRNTTTKRPAKNLLEEHETK